MIWVARSCHGQARFADQARGAAKVDHPGLKAAAYRNLPLLLQLPEYQSANFKPDHVIMAAKLRKNAKRWGYNGQAIPRRNHFAASEVAPW